MSVSRSIFLIGFSGSGKSTVGRALAARLNVPFTDTDELIEQAADQPISSLLRADDQERFRALERQVIVEVAADAGGAGVVSLGGGAFESTENRAVIRDAGRVVYLRCAVRELYRRLKDVSDRPLLQVTPRSGESLRAAKLRRIRD
ncbi:AAA family ATPase, partial [candidate division GN15 bacterium]|nr:AAA family ATPase [candidate division GN15 bacterium]